jgi:hypothetical protein
MLEFGGILYLLGVAFAIWAIIEIVGSGAPTLHKTLWTVFVLVLPVLGFIIWFFTGPRRGTTVSG